MFIRLKYNQLLNRDLNKDYSYTIVYIVYHMNYKGTEIHVIIEYIIIIILYYYIIISDNVLISI